MAATIVAVGKQMGITRRGIEIGISVATEQSSLRPEAINSDWLGLFQQNPVTYTQYKRTEPGGAAWMFYDQLIKQVPGYDTDPRQDFEIGDVVQKTTTGERFAQYKDMAADLAGQLIDAVSLQQDDVTCTPAPAAQTTTGSAFDPGNIISDAVFYNTSAMTVDQIRVFIRAEGEACVGAYCLKNLVDHLPEPTRRPVLRGLPGRHQRGRGHRHRQVLHGLRDQPAGHAGHPAEGIRVCSAGPTRRRRPTTRPGAGTARTPAPAAAPTAIRPTPGSSTRATGWPSSGPGTSSIRTSTTTTPARRSTSCGTSSSPAADRRR